MTALVGQSGSGKSSLLSLVPRIYDPKSGILEIDGQNIKDVNLFSLRKVDIMDFMELRDVGEIKLFLNGFYL